MHARKYGGMLIAVLLSAVPVASVASASFEQSLQEADRIRSSDPDRFNLMLDSLDSRKGQADPLQRQRLRYLRIYSMVTSGSNSELALEKAKVLFNEATDADFKFRIGALIVNIYAVNRNFSEGLRYLDQNLSARDRVQDKDLLNDGRTTAATLYNELGQYKLGLRFAEEALSSDPKPRSKCFAGYMRLRAMYHMGSLGGDGASIEGVIDECAGVGEKFAANYGRALLARTWADQGRRGDAITLLRSHLREVEATRFPRLIGEIHSLLAELLLANGEIEAAATHAQDAVARSAGLANSLPLVMAHKVMYEIAVRRRDPVTALAHYRDYAEADKGYLNEVKVRELVFQVARQENIEKTQQIQLLDQQNQVLQLRQRVQRQDLQNMGLLAVLLGALALAVGYWAYGVKRMHLSLRRFAETDALTGISNRHHFTQQSEHSLAGCASTGGPAALILFDLDHFKAVNDTYGHDTGDWVLKQVADTCRAFCRRMDHLGRIGGEEFAILLHGCDLQAATRLAGDCRVRLSRIDTRASGYAFAVTASFGVSATSLSGYRLSALMSHADLALYRAKREGRNRVRAYTRDDVPASPRQALPALSTEASVAAEAVSSDASHA